MKSSGSTEEYRPGDVVPFHWHIGTVTAAFFVCLTASIIGVELLYSIKHRELNVWKRFFKQFPCQWALGSAAVFNTYCMGISAAIMGSGHPDLQLRPPRSFLITGSVIPMVAWIVAIEFLQENPTEMYSVCISTVFGLHTGASNIAVFFLATLAWENYEVEYLSPYAAGATCLALAAGLSFFYMHCLQHQRLSRSICWRMFSALVYALLVCSSFWVASNGTLYRLRHCESSLSASYIVAVVVVFFHVPIFIGIAYLIAQRRNDINYYTGHIILAYARFDEQGRLMLDENGFLPAQRIGPNSNHNCVPEDFDVSSPAFEWISQVSYCWESVEHCIPQMRHGLELEQIPDTFLRRVAGDLRSSTSSPNILISGSTDPTQSRIFRWAFCVAAYNLRQKFAEAFGEMGTLYCDIIKIGQINGFGKKRFENFLKRCVPEWLYKGGTSKDSQQHELFNKGLMLLIHDQCDESTAIRLSFKGYQFVHLDKAVNSLAQRIRIPPSSLMLHLESARKGASLRGQKRADSLLLGFFALKPGILREGWKVLVQKEHPDLIPFSQLPKKTLSDTEKELLNLLEGASVSACIDILQKVQDKPIHREFVEVLLAGIKHLSDAVAENILHQAIFCSTIFKMSIHETPTGPIKYCGLLVFHAIQDIHESPVRTMPSLTYSPFSFFRRRQHVRYSASHCADFKRDVQIELARGHSRSGSWADVRDEENQSLREHGPHGGVMVTQYFGMSTEPVTEKIEKLPSSFDHVIQHTTEIEAKDQIWVDLLYNITVESWRRSRRETASRLKERHTVG